MKGITFYTLSARFNMCQYGDLVVKSFKKRENALKFALEQKERFLKEIRNRELDEQETMDCFSEPEEKKVYYGVCKDGENFLEIRIEPDSLMDN